MKIVLFPGVGLNEDLSKPQKFLDEISKNIKCETEIFNWKHKYQDKPYVDNKFSDLPYEKYRSLFSEIVLDFQHVLKYAKTMDVPEADIYIGHSAGSIIALAKNKPCILFGSPAFLIEDFRFDSSIEAQNNLLKDRKVLNIVHERDIIAFPLYSGDIDNFIFSGCKFNIKDYCPLSAHRSYWESKDVRNKIISTLNEWTIQNEPNGL